MPFGEAWRSLYAEDASCHAIVKLVACMQHQLYGERMFIELIQQNMWYTWSHQTNWT